MTELETLCRKLKITSRITGDHPKHECDKDSSGQCWKCNANAYTVRLRFQGRSLTVPFWQGVGINDDPGAADVLYCLAMDANSVDSGRDFEDFCSEYGYDPDSRKAERIYNELCKLSPRVRRFLGAAFNEVLEAQH